MRCPRSLCCLAAALLGLLLPSGCGEGVRGWKSAEVVEAQIGPLGGALSLSWVSLEMGPGFVTETANVRLREIPPPGRRGAIGRVVEVTIEGAVPKQLPRVSMEPPDGQDAERLALAYLQPGSDGGSPQWIPLNEQARDPQSGRLVARAIDFNAHGPTLPIAAVLSCGDGIACPKELAECRAGACQ